MEDNIQSNEYDTKPAETLVFLDDGRGYRQLPNGALADAKTGKIVKAPTHPTITKENAREMHKLRRAKAVNALVRGIAAGTKSPDFRTGIERLAEAQAIIANDPENKRAATEAFKALLQALELWPDRRGTGDDTAQKPGEGMTIEQIHGKLDELRAAREQIEAAERAFRAIDARARDASE